MQRLSLSLNAGKWAGNQVDANLLGGNFVFSHDRVDGTFGDRAADMGTTFLRFPGGTVTEHLFDPANPDATSASFLRDDGVMVTRRLEPLTEFLDHLTQTGQAGLFVIPTYRYLDENGNAPAALSAEDEAGLRHYIRSVLQSGVEVKGFELGNEFMLLDGFSIAEYAHIAGQIALIADQEVTAWGQDHPALAHGQDPMIILQATLPSQLQDLDGDGVARAIEAAEHLFASLPEGAMEAIDGLSAHRYISGAYSGIDNFDALWKHLDAMSELAGRDLPVVLSEWNIKSNQAALRDWDSADEAARDQYDTGLKQAGALAAYFHEIAANGVDMAAIWGVQQQNPMGLAPREGVEGPLEAGGVMMGLLARETLGMRALTTRQPDPRLDFHAFANREDQLLILNSRSGEALDLTLNLSAYVGSARAQWVHIIGAADGFDPRDPDVAVTQTRLDGADFGAGQSFRLTLQPYEVAVLRFDVPPPNADDFAPMSMLDRLLAGGFDGTEMAAPAVQDAPQDLAQVQAEASDPNARSARALIAAILGRARIDDPVASEALIEMSLDQPTRRGSIADDELRSGAQGTTLIGRMGRDILFGAQGNDLLTGGLGADTLYGGDGDDLLMGDEQNDALFGGDGDDRLIGGAGRDSFAGGAGRDIFHLNAGDEAWREEIMDFMRGEDRLSLSTDLAADFGAIRQSFKDGLLIVNYRQGSLALYDQDELLDEEDFIFI